MTVSQELNVHRGAAVCCTCGVVQLCTVHVVCSRSEYKAPMSGYYGSIDENGAWDGVIGMIVDQQAEVGLNVLDYDSIRLDAVDFFPPLWNLK